MSDIDPMPDATRTGATESTQSIPTRDSQNDSLPPPSPSAMDGFDVVTLDQVISKADRIVSIHSEDEEILNIRKKFIKKGDVRSHPEWRNSETAMSSTRRVVKIAERYDKKLKSAIKKDS